MINGKHTQGPWKARKLRFHHVVESLNVRVAEIRYINSGGYSSEADAHLIAAAPGLLEALKAMLFELVERHEDIYVAYDFKNNGIAALMKYMPEDGWRDPSIPLSIAAIAKAQGE